MISLRHWDTVYSIQIVVYSPSIEDKLKMMTIFESFRPMVVKISCLISFAVEAVCVAVVIVDGVLCLSIVSSSVVISGQPCGLKI